MGNESGVALIAAVMAVAVLLAIGLSFAFNMRLEEKAAANQMWALKAKYIAIAGIEQAITAMKIYAAEKAYVSDSDDWYYSDADYPSFDDPDGTASPSGNRISQTFTIGDLTATYALKVLDCAGQIYLNDGRDAGSGEGSTILDEMLDALDDIGPATADAIIAYRNSWPNDILITKEEVRGVSGINEATYIAFKDDVAVNTWVDPDTVDPDDTTGTYYETEARAPINVNTASDDVLSGVLKDLSYGSSLTSGELTDVITQIKSGRPYSTWKEFHDNGLYPWAAGSILTRAAKMYMIEANANPNTDLMNFNPNRSWSDLRDDTTNIIDKTDLDANGTTSEFCFNSGGYYEIECVGKVGRDWGDGGGATPDGDLEDISGTAPLDEVYAEKKIRAVVKIFDIWRQSTQAQFANGTISQVSSVNTLYSYPEPTDAGITAASYDGQIMLANVETTGGLFRASFNDGLDAETGETATTDLDKASVISGGDLSPDGVYIGGSESLYYSASGNIENDDGTIEMWVKPNYTTAGSHYFFEINNGTEYMKLWDDSGVLTFRIDADDTTGSGGTLESFEATYATTLNAGEWYHIAATWDYDDNDATAGGQGQVKLFLDGSSVDTGTASATFDLTPLPATEDMYIGSDISPANRAESTIDEIRISNSWSNSITVPDRYYDPPPSSNAIFTSSNFNAGSTVQWGTISWTEWLPADGTEIQNANIKVQTESASSEAGLDGSNWLPATEFDDPTASNAITSDDNQWFRYRVIFEADAGTSTYLRDTPILDDVTITYLPETKILYWREVTE